MRLTGKVVVVTGGSMGIGEEIARAFLREGASVALCSREQSRAEAARQRLGAPERTLAVGCDVRKRSELEALLKATLDRFGRVDVWVNNAGHGLMDAVAEMDMQQCRSMFDTNLFGAIEAMQVVVPQMKKQGGGTIVNISSVAGHIAVPGMAAYSGTKFALNAMGKAARVELKASGVRVMTVCPGYIATDFGVNAVRGKASQRLGAAKNRIGPERVGKAVVRGYLRKSREVVAPWRDRAIIKLYQMFPRFVEWSMAQMLRPAEEVLAEQQARRRRNG